MFVKNWNKSPLHPALLLATWFYSGLFPKAPGTMGSLAALPFAWLIIERSGPIGLSVAILLSFGAGLWASDVYMKETGRTDPGEVVIDEVAGQWIACLPIAAMHSQIGLSPGPFILAFVTFRIFDIYKPWPIKIFDQRHDAYGVMMDDVIAGFFASVFVIGFYLYVLP
ncbi:phosphatidylglycerophosphatase A [Paremcibacter congregatus]|uniref:phosphatidylglycerophosphatase A family protein n=1 Tax=Paremcibacter congregatus TaxID=2043170 RepID=UPI003A8EE42E